MRKIMNHFNKFHWGLLLVISCLIIYFENPTTPMGAVSAIAGITGLLCVIEVGNGRISNFYWGIVNIALYAYLAYSASLYGDFMLNALYYFPMQFVGMYMWRKHTSEDGKLEAKTMTNAQKAILTVVSAALIIGYANFLVYLGGSIAYIDATSTVLSVIAMILMVRRFAEQWIIWIVVNAVSVVMWTISLNNGEPGSAGMILMWTGYLANAIYSYIKWKKMAEEN